MAFSVAPDLIEAIVAYAKDALPHIVVSDGFAVTSDNSETLMIGVDDPNVDGAQFSVEGERDFVNGGLDGIIAETGEIVCAATAWIGDDDPLTPRRRVYDIADKIAELCAIRGATDPAFGVEKALWTVAGRRHQLLQMAGDGGCAAILIFRIYYEGRP